MIIGLLLTERLPVHPWNLIQFQIKMHFVNARFPPLSISPNTLTAPA